MIWFLLTLPFKFLGLGFRLGAGSMKLTHGTLRFMGYRRLFVFGVGVGVGLLVAPGPGAALRAKLRTLIDELQGAGGNRGGSAGDLASRVRDELASSPRTWHLPQPAVSVAGDRVVLAGDVPDDAARGDLERVAAAVRGVVSVDNRLTIAST